MIVESITPYPSTMELKVVIRTGEFLEEAATLWMEYRSGLLNLVEPSEPLPEGVDLNTVRSWTILKMANCYLTHNEAQKQEAKKIEEIFRAPLETPPAT